MLLIALVAGFAVCVPLVSQASAASSSSLKDQLQDTQAKLQQVRANLAKAKAAREAAQDDITALDKNIDSAQDDVDVATAAYDESADKLAGLRKQLNEVTAQLNQKRDQLTNTQKDLNTEQDTFDARLANVYKSGGRMMYLAALLEGGVSISELIGRIDMLSSIAEQDSEMVNAIKDLKAKIEEQKAALETQRAQVADVEQQQRAQTKELAAVADTKQGALDELEQARAQKQKIVAAAEKDEAAWNKQEDQLLSESDQITADIRKAEAQANQGQSSGGGSGKLYRPVPGSIGSPFGMRLHPIFHTYKMHTGVDMHAGMGESIHAAAAGTVISAGWRGGYGQCVIIQHAGNLSTLYAHQSKILVSVGQKVTRGQVIGKVGSTGYSTGPHLHFEVRVSGSPVNPANYL